MSWKTNYKKVKKDGVKFGDKIKAAIKAALPNNAVINSESFNWENYRFFFFYHDATKSEEDKLKQIEVLKHIKSGSTTFTDGYNENRYTRYLTGYTGIVLGMMLSPELHYEYLNPKDSILYFKFDPLSGIRKTAAQLMDEIGINDFLAQDEYVGDDAYYAKLFFYDKFPTEYDTVSDTASFYVNDRSATRRELSTNPLDEDNKDFIKGININDSSFSRYYSRYYNRDFNTPSTTYGYISISSEDGFRVEQITFEYGKRYPSRDDAQKENIKQVSTIYGLFSDGWKSRCYNDKAYGTNGSESYTHSPVGLYSLSELNDGSFNNPVYFLNPEDGDHTLIEKTIKFKMPITKSIDNGYDEGVESSSAIITMEYNDDMYINENGTEHSS